jgi:lipopolysaccharide transport system ATP-binding protein
VPSSQIQNSLEYRDMREHLINGSTLRNDIEIFQFQNDKAGFGTGEANITSVRLLDQGGAPLSWIVGGEDVILDIRCFAHKEIIRPIVGFQFKDRLGQVIFADNTYTANLTKSLVVGAGVEIVARFEFRLPVLPSGDYSISPAVAAGTQEEHIQHHWLHDALMLRVHASSICFGLVGIPMKKISLITQ